MHVWYHGIVEFVKIIVSKSYVGGSSTVIPKHLNILVHGIKQYFFESAYILNHQYHTRRTIGDKDKTVQGARICGNPKTKPKSTVMTAALPKPTQQAVTVPDPKLTAVQLHKKQTETHLSQKTILWVPTPFIEKMWRDLQPG